MKIIRFFLFFTFISSIIVFISCDGDIDTQGPNIYFLNSETQVISDSEADKTILLYSVYSEYGIKVEDNVSDSENVVIDSDIAEVFPVNINGQVKQTGTFTVTYTATDEAQNVSTKNKNIIVENISVPFTGSYYTHRIGSEIADTTYNSTLIADTRISGRILFPKVYAQSFDGESSYFKVSADLFSLNHSAVFSETLAYTGKASDSESSFFSGLTYDEALDSIMNFDLLKVDAQVFVDDLGNNVQIAGREQNNVPLSRIEYVAGTKAISRIVLELNVTFNEIPDSQVIEVYTPQ
jgi:hypothetical protein